MTAVDLLCIFTKNLNIQYYNRLGHEQAAVLQKMEIPESCPMWDLKLSGSLGLLFTWKIQFHILTYNTRIINFPICLQYRLTLKFLIAKYNDRRISFLKHTFLSFLPQVLGPSFDVSLLSTAHSSHSEPLNLPCYLLGLSIDSVWFFLRKITACKGEILVVFLPPLPSQQFNLLPINLTPRLMEKLWGTGWVS